MRRWKIQNHNRHSPVHRLRGSKILRRHRRDGRRDVSRVPYQFQLAYFQLGRRCVYLQRRVYRTQRRHVHGLRRRNLQGHDR